MAWQHQISDDDLIILSALIFINLSFPTQMRSSLSGITGLKVDASILDEARINRPGAKTYEYKNAPQFGTYRPVGTPLHSAVTVRRLMLSRCVLSRCIAQAARGEADEGRAGQVRLQQEGLRGPSRQGNKDACILVNKDACMLVE